MGSASIYCEVYPIKNYITNSIFNFIVYIFTLYY